MATTLQQADVSNKMRDPDGVSVCFYAVRIRINREEHSEEVMFYVPEGAGVYAGKFIQQTWKRMAAYKVRVIPKMTLA